MKSKRSIGTEYEEKAALYLEAHGYRILEKNVNYPWGEIDLVALDVAQNELVFVEVRKKEPEAMVTPAESITYPKQQRLRRAIETYLVSPEYGSHDLNPGGIRVDLVAFEGECIAHWKSFF